MTFEAFLWFEDFPGAFTIFKSLNLKIVTLFSKDNIICFRTGFVRIHCDENEGFSAGDPRWDSGFKGQLLVLSPFIAIDFSSSL